MAVGAIIGGIAALGSTIYQISQSEKQKKQAEQARKSLQEPEINIPSAVYQRAYEPIAEEYVEMQEAGDRRRTSQSLDALGQAGPRAILGGTQQVVDTERRSQRQRVGQYEQARQDALAQLGEAQQAKQRGEIDRYLSKLQAVRGLSEASDRNMARALGTLGNYGSQAVKLDMYNDMYGDDPYGDLDAGGVGSTSAERASGESIVDLPERGI